MSKKFKLILIISIITLLVIGGGVTGIVIANKLTATTMRLKDTDGSVFLFSKDNRQRNITYDLRLQNGNRLETDSLSEARVSLDDTKLVVVKQVSTVHFEQRAKKLKLLLDEGSIFFYVSRKLTENEELNICTSSMMAGIRGTSGYLDIKDERTQILYLTSGKVEITIAGSDEKYTVTAGEKLTLTDGINARVESFKATEMPHDLIEEVVDSVKLINTVCEETGWNIADIINNADQRGIKVNKLVREIIGQTEENHNIPDDTSGRDDVGEDAQTSDERNDQDQATSNDNNETDPENIPESEWKAALLEHIPVADPSSVWEYNLLYSIIYINDDQIPEILFYDTRSYSYYIYYFDIVDRDVYYYDCGYCNEYKYAPYSGYIYCYEVYDTRRDETGYRSMESYFGNLSVKIPQEIAGASFIEFSHEMVYEDVRTFLSE